MTIIEYNELYQKIEACKCLVDHMPAIVKENDWSRMQSLIPDDFASIVMTALEHYLAKVQQEALISEMPHKERDFGTALHMVVKYNKAMRLPDWKKEECVRVGQNGIGQRPYLYLEFASEKIPWWPNESDLFRNDWELIDKNDTNKAESHSDGAHLLPLFPLP